jgi:hypothetical protein
MQPLAMRLVEQLRYQMMGLPLLLAIHLMMRHFQMPVRLTFSQNLEAHGHSKLKLRRQI